MIATFGKDKSSLKILTQYYSFKNHIEFISILNKTLNKVFILSIFLVVTICSAKILFGNILNIKTYLFVCSMVLIPLKSLSSIYFSAIRAVEKPKVYLFLDLIIRKSLLIFSILLIRYLNWISIDTFHILCFTVIIYLAIIIFSNFYVKDNLYHKNINQEPNIKNLNQNSISLYIFFIQSITLFNLNIDNILIEYYMDIKNISYYKVSSQIVMISGFTLNAINVFLSPVIAKLYFKNKIKKLQKKLTLISKLNLISGIISFLFIVFFLLILIGNARGNGWKMVSKVPENFINQIKVGLLPTAEFRGVNFTVDWALSRDYLTLKKRKDMFTWNRMIFYPLPTYTYRSIFKKEKIPTISRVIGDEVKEYVFEDSIDKKLGYALSPIAEGYINFGTLGVLILGLFYGFCINFLQFQYNNISYKSINLFDILILNSISIIPLIMRAGTAGIYNYILSISFAIFISLLSLIFFDKLRTLYVKKIK